MNPQVNNQILRTATWNAQSLLNKKGQLETLIWQQNLDLVWITETWFYNKIQNFKIKGFNIIRSDRKNQTPRGGTSIFIKSTYTFEKMDLSGPWEQYLEIVGVKIQNNENPLY